MLKKAVLGFILMFAVLTIAVMLNKEKFFVFVKTNPLLNRYAKKILAIGSTSKSDENLKTNSLSQEIINNYAITIDANKVIGTFDNFYRGIGMGTFNDGYMKAHNYAFFKLVGEMNRRMQFIAYSNTKCIFVDEPTKGVRDYGAHVYKLTAAGQPTYNWAIVDNVIDRTLENGLKPIISLTFMPEAMASDPDRKNPWNKGVISPPANYNDWRELIYQTIKHLKERYGAKEISKWYFEVWNEPDLFKFFWLPHPDRQRYPFKGDYEEYFKLYDYAVAGALAAETNIKIGGPAIAGDVELFLKEFLHHCYNGKNSVTGQVGTRIDFVSRHHYGYIVEEIMPGYKQFIDMIKQIAGQRFDDLEILITETGPSTKPDSWLNDRYVAAWIVKEVAAFLNLKEQSGIDYLPDIVCFWAHPVAKNFNDAFGLATVLGDKHLPSADALIKRPAFNAYQAMKMLGEECIALSGSTFGDPVHGIATRANDGSVVVALYSLIEGDTYNNRDDNFFIDLSIHGCKNEEYTFECYAIDGNHSNAFPLWRKMGSPNYPEPDKLRLLQVKDDLELSEPATKILVNDGIFKRQIRMQNNSVVLIKLYQSTDHIQPNEPTNLRAELDELKRTVSLTWAPPMKARDGERAVSYAVYRSNELIGRIFDPAFVDRKLNDAAEYVYAIYAVDKAGNMSATPAKQTIRISKDVNNPQLLNLSTFDETTVALFFDEPIDAASASNVHNYHIDGIDIQQAVYLPDDQKVVLSTSTHKPDKQYTLVLENIADCAQIPNKIQQQSYQYEFVISFIDKFTNNTVSNYEWTRLAGSSTECRYYHDQENERLLIIVGDDNKLKCSHKLASTKQGKFTLKFQPVKMYPDGGAIGIYLKEDENNYFKISNTDGYGPGIIEKVIAGQSVESRSFNFEYEQNNNYLLELSFSPKLFVVNAFNDNLSLQNNHKQIHVKSFEIELTQQDAYIDDLEFSGY